MPPSPQNTAWPWESDDPPEQYQDTYKQRSPSSRKSTQQQHQHQYPQPTAASNEAFVKEMLVAHNRYRTMHQAPPLTLDKELTRGAQEWAEGMANQDRLEPDMDCKTEHIGESLAMKYNSDRTDFSGSEFTDYWYSGISDYDFPEQSPRLSRGSAVLSFTQLVWKASRTVGFGRAVSRRGKVFVVGRYYPGGNSVEGFAENVQPSQERASKSPSAARHSRANEPRPSVGSRMVEHNKPVIGAMKPTDHLVSSKKSTVIEDDKTIVTVEEKYLSQDGGTYTRQRTTTYFGEHSG